MSKRKKLVLLLLTGTMLIGIPNKVAATVGQWSPNGTSLNYISGNVGIGTNTPGYSLEVNGGTKINSLNIQGNMNLNYEVWDGGNSKISSNKHITAILGDNNGSSRFRITDNMGVEKFGVSSSGNVGIGTVYPVDKLDVRGNTYFGSGNDYTYNKLVIRGPNAPADGNSKQDISYEFNGAGSAKIRGFRSSSWGTNLNILTNSQYQNSDNPTSRMLITSEGYIGIGTDNPTQLLSVNGKILAKELLISNSSTNWPDYVFDKNYKLKTLNEVEDFINMNKHLPGVSSSNSIQKEGTISIGEMQRKEMEKIEELTLHLINLNKKVTSLEEQNQLLKEEIQLLKLKH